MNPNMYPNTILILSAHTALDRGDALSPDQRPTHIAVMRILDTRQRIARLMWVARAEVVRDQLRAQRGTFA